MTEDEAKEILRRFENWARQDPKCGRLMRSSLWKSYHHSAPSLPDDDALRVDRIMAELRQADLEVYTRLREIGKGQRTGTDKRSLMAISKFCRALDPGSPPD